VHTHVLRICFYPAEYPLAWGSLVRIMGCADPAWDVEMLGGFMTFPVGFAAEGFGAVRECAAIWSFVAFLVFPSVG
jgi:hypothetical protein